MTPASLLTEWARLLIGSLARAGVSEAVISPGSRSTPFTWAALREPGLRCRTIIDERSAAFFAVGQAKMTGVPSLLVCTSGSAAANYFPAIIEAERSGTPLVVLTADRPFELQSADAPQTIDQVKLYGDAVRAFFETGMPDASAGALVGLRRIAAQAVLLARGPVPGPVHVNARARAPLEPVAADDDEARALAAAVDRLLAEPATLAPPPRLLPTADAIRSVARACARARRGVIVCGPMSPWQAPSAATVADLARRTGFPVLAEATSQLRFVERDGTGARGTGRTTPARVDGFDALLRSESFRARFRPEVVLRLGGTPTSTAWRDLLERSARPTGDDAPVREHVFAPNGWSDPHATAASMLICSLEPALRALVDALGDDAATADDAAADRRAWNDLLAAAGRAAADALGTPRPGFDEGEAVRVLIESLPAGALLGVGNSLPVREVDTFTAPCGRPIAVWSQRGANGIDGLVSGAAGAAAAAGRPAALLLGDVSALHDAGGFAVARDAEQPLAIVVLDNGGGRIFEQLPLARAGTVAESDWRAWLTPPRVDFEALARAFGIRYARADAADPARAALIEALARPGATLVHVVVDGARTIPAHREYWAEVDRRVAALP